MQSFKPICFQRASFADGMTDQVDGDRVEVSGNDDDSLLLGKRHLILGLDEDDGPRNVSRLGGVFVLVNVQPQSKP